MTGITIIRQGNGVRIAYVVDDKIITSEYCQLSGQGIDKDIQPGLVRMSHHAGLRR